MSGECEKCHEHCVDCKCDQKLDLDYAYVSLYDKMKGVLIDFHKSKEDGSVDGLKVINTLSIFMTEVIFVAKTLDEEKLHLSVQTSVNISVALYALLQSRNKKEESKGE